MLINELAQWAALVFIGVFTLGLTRQLGRALNLRDLQRPSIPRIAAGDQLPHGLFDDETRIAAADVLATAPSRQALVAVVSEGCGGCDTLLASLEQRGRPEGFALLGVSQVTSARNEARLAHIFDVVSRDPMGARSAAAGLAETPLVLIVDEAWTVLHVDPGGDVHRAVASWEAARADGPGQLQVHAVGDEVHALAAS